MHQFPNQHVTNVSQSCNKTKDLFMNQMMQTSAFCYRFKQQIRVNLCFKISKPKVSDLSFCTVFYIVRLHILL